MAVNVSTLADEDAEARRLIGSDLDHSFLVEAAAGTGKTTMLVRRLVAVLEAGRADVDGIVAVTFTRKAAGELKLRLRQALDERRAALDEAGARQRLERAIARLEEAHIGTIHAFCAEILRLHPVEAGVDPSFGELDEAAGRSRFEHAFNAWATQRLADPPEGLRRALARLAGQRTEGRSSPLDRLRDAGFRLVDWRDFPAPWQRPAWDRRAGIDVLLVEIGDLAQWLAPSSNPRDPLRRALEPVARLWSWLRTSARARGWQLDPRDATASRHNCGQRAARDDDALEARLVRLLFELRRNRGIRGRGRWFAPDLERSEVVAARDRLLVALAAFQASADADLAACLKRELDEVVAGYEEAKKARGRLDFLDLLLRTRDLVRDHADVRRTLQQRYSHLFVDELQDTDPLQAEILLLLAADNPETSDWRQARPAAGKLFGVGDPKQSIYRFRRADVLLYQDLKDRLRARGVRLIYLARSFRSQESLQQAVNAAFAPRMLGDRETGQAEYVPLLPGRGGGQPERAQPTLVTIPVPRPYGRYGIDRRQIEASLPEAIAGWIHWLIEHSGWTIEEPGSGRQVAIRPRHIALLFRRFAASWGNDAGQPYVRALEARGVAHLLVSDRSFFDRAEIATLRAALTAIEWPDDELSVFATLRGALFAIPDSALLRYRLQGGRLDPFAHAAASGEANGDALAFAPIHEALAMLATLHEERNRVAVAETIRRLLDATRAHAGLALRPAGKQVLANVARLADMARSFEQRGGLSFRGFVEALADAAESPGSTPTPTPVEAEADGVRMMTVHAAKGLEFPVVVLADLTTRLVREQPQSFMDPARGLYAQRLLRFAPQELLDHATTEQARDAAESERLAYVATTRARDLLAAPGLGDDPYKGGWLAALDGILYPSPKARRAASPAPGCPAFGAHSVLDWPDVSGGDRQRSVQPGLHQTTSGVSVVWWDPALLAPQMGRRRGLRHEALLADGPGAEAAAQCHRDWQQTQRAARARGTRPSLRTCSVSEAPAPVALEPVEVAIESTERSPGRPGGERFGTLVHALLRAVELRAAHDTIADLARLHGRIFQAPANEIQAASLAVTRALEHPLLERAAAAAEVRRETPFVIEADDVLIEGVIDLAFREDDGSDADGGAWIVVDFKTDHNLDGALARYRKQLAWYLVAVEKLTGKPAKGVLLAV